MMKDKFLKISNLLQSDILVKYNKSEFMENFLKYKSKILFQQI